jgi:spore coat protein U-like protein
MEKSRNWYIFSTIIFKSYFSKRSRKKKKTCTNVGSKLEIYCICISYASDISFGSYMILRYSIKRTNVTSDAIKKTNCYVFTLKYFTSPFKKMNPYFSSCSFNTSNYFMFVLYRNEQKSFSYIFSTISFYFIYFAIIF